MGYCHGDWRPLDQPRITNLVYHSSVVTKRNRFKLLIWVHALLCVTVKDPTQWYPDNGAKDRSANDTSAKPEVRMPTVRTRQQCEMRQKCEGQVCEGQECECDFSANGQNSEAIQIVRSRSLCLPSGWSLVFKKKKKNSLSLCASAKCKTLSQSLSFSLG